MEFISTLFSKKGTHNTSTEILSGLTVALALVPEAIAFAMIAGFSPLTGLYAAFVMGFVTSILGGRPGMISGATGAVAVVFGGLCLAVRNELGSDIPDSTLMQYVFATVILAGCIQILAGILKLGKFVRLVPQPVMYGFVNGLAIVIFSAQFPNFTNILHDTTISNDMRSTQLIVMSVLVVLTMLIIWLLPKFTKKIPSSLAAIVIISILVYAFNIQTTTVADTLAEGMHLKGSFPPISIPHIPINWKTIMLILPYSSIIAGVGLIESLLTLNLIDEITETRGSGNRECIAQGCANITSGLLSGMGGCAMIGQSLINITAGARQRLSGIVASSMLLIFVIFGSKIIEKMPMAALVGVMFMVAIGTFEWASLRVFRKMPWTDVAVMITVTLITAITHNLAIAVLIGIILSALTFSWESAKHIQAHSYIDENGIKHYELFGPLFFASTKGFTEQFSPSDDPNIVIMDFKHSRILDMSAISALNNITKKYRDVNKELHLRHLSEDSRVLLSNAEAIIEVNVLEDPHYKVVTNKIKELQLGYKKEKASTYQVKE
ncbi:MAG TPA: SulP family inorganic anion transporter [Bacteroidaceae bacterium]|nr:SulP family inorganic anion transporter [Bacteroidaceae bacterium]